MTKKTPAVATPKLSNKEALLSLWKPKTVPFPVEGFGDLLISQLSVKQVEDLREAVKKAADVTIVAGHAEESTQYAFGLRLVVHSVMDADGVLIFDESDLPRLEASNNAAIDELVGKALEVNGFVKVPGGKN